MKKNKEFLELLKQTKNMHALGLIEDWEKDDQFMPVLELEFTEPNLTILRRWISYFFADRLSGICTDALWQRYQEKHIEFIREFDGKARTQGLIITEKRQPISFAEGIAMAQQTRGGSN